MHTSRLTMVATAVAVTMTALAMAARPVSAQGCRALSPRMSNDGTVGGKKLTVSYGSPSVRQRTIFGGLVPYGKEWRTGANEATVLETTSPITIGGKDLQAGRYSIFTLPAADKWKVFVNSRPDVWGTEHDAATDLATLTDVIPTTVAQTERLTMKIVETDAAAKTGELVIAWETTEVHIPFTVKP